MPGSEVLMHLRELDPEVRVVILTGFAPEELTLDAITELLFKPFRLEELLAVVRRVLPAD
jgi:DNA-binding NtrC family response regulator